MTCSHSIGKMALSFLHYLNFNTNLLLIFGVPKYLAILLHPKPGEFIIGYLPNDSIFHLLTDHQFNMDYWSVYNSFRRNIELWPNTQQILVWMKQYGLIFVHQISANRFVLKLK